MLKKNKLGIIYFFMAVYMFVFGLLQENQGIIRFIFWVAATISFLLVAIYYLFMYKKPNE